MNWRKRFSLIFSLAPGFSRVSRGPEIENRFNGLSSAHETAEAVKVVPLLHTRLKPGANERHFAALCLCWLVFSACTLFAATNSPSPTNASSRNIGIEGSVSITLPRADYQPLPLDDRTELILRIDKITALASNRHRYDFFYMGLEPGAYQLADYLIRPDGSRPDELGELRLLVRSILPEDHDGKLNAYVPRLFPFIGGYRAFLGLLACLWVGSLVLYLVITRKKRVVESVTVFQRPPSFAERLRPLVEEAASGKLNVEGQATLERLLMGYWREKLNLPHLRMAEALAQLKAHGEAGELLRALERWLHRPGVVSAQEIGSLLQPYRNLPAPTAAMEGVAS